MLRNMWNLPRPGIEPVSPPLTGGLFTTEPSGEPSFCLVNFEFIFSYLNLFLILRNITEYKNIVIFPIVVLSWFCLVFWTDAIIVILYWGQIISNFVIQTVHEFIS